MNNVRFIIQASKGLLRDQRMRRLLMFYDVLAVLLMSFAGSTFFWSWLRHHPFFFLGYWGVCGWLTMLAALLAIYDLAMIRLEARRLRRQIKKDILGDVDPDSSHDSHTH